MRKVTFGGANSLDNYLARPDHAVDWLLWEDEAAAVMKDFWKTIDTVLMGRKTYEVAARSTWSSRNAGRSRTAASTSPIGSSTEAGGPYAILLQTGVNEPTAAGLPVWYSDSPSGAIREGVVAMKPALLFQGCSVFLAACAGRGEPDENGSALVVHPDPDDSRSQPSGGSGTPIACGVIEG